MSRVTTNTKIDMSKTKYLNNSYFYLKRRTSYLYFQQGCTDSTC